MRIIKRKYIHPDTGDVLTFSEKISWFVQSIIRNWWFVCFWLVSSILWWMHPAWFKDNTSYVHWQLWASWLAVAVELVIGIAMIGQTKRDAQIIRHLLKLQKDQMDDLSDITREIKNLMNIEKEQLEQLEEFIEEHDDH